MSEEDTVIVDIISMNDLPSLRVDTFSSLCQDEHKGPLRFHQPQPERGRPGRLVCPTTSPTAEYLQKHLELPAAELYFSRIDGAFVYPHHGAVMLEQGYRMLDASLAGITAEDISRVDKLRNLPGCQVTGDKEIRLDRQLLDHAPRIEGCCLYSLHAGAGTYGHWLYDCLPPLYAVLQEISAQNLLILTGPLASWQAESLALLGVEGRLHSTTDKVVRCERLILASYIDISNTRRCSPITIAMFDHLRQRADVGGGERSRLYVSRRDWPQRRRMTNEAAVERALTAEGFRVIQPEQMSFKEQIAAFSSADVVVAPVGSANVNIGFAEPPCTLVEIFVDGYVDAVFCRLAILRGVNYAFHQEYGLFQDEALEALDGYRLSHQLFSYHLDIPRLIQLVGSLAGGKPTAEMLGQQGADMASTRGFLGSLLRHPDESFAAWQFFGASASRFIRSVAYSRMRRSQR